jgi:ribosomal protein S18 acetylase RimI-like enzyme
MPLPDGPDPWFGLSPETLRFLEVHPARAVAIPGRGWRDVGDAVTLFSAAEKEPFFNRVTAIRWPEDPRAFDARLAQTLELFAALDRRPYFWVIPGLSTPADLVARLAANGFVDQGGGYDMLLIRDPVAIRQAPLPAGAVLEKWNNPSDADRPTVAAALALVISESFGIPGDRRPNLIAEISLTLQQPRFHACASYISSIGTRPQWRGHGFGGHITLALARDSLADGVDLVYLGVYAENLKAIRLYDRLGFGLLGSRSADMLLGDSREERSPGR